MSSQVIAVVPDRRALPPTSDVESFFRARFARLVRAHTRWRTLRH